MQHLDEARIVEYLDRRNRETDSTADDVADHLATCTECRAIADRLRAERGQAAAILSRSGPAEIVPPPFDEIVERGARARRPGGHALRVLALAATAVIVGGVGWLGRDIAVRSRESTPVAVRQESPPARADVARDADEAFRDEAERNAAAEPAPVTTPAAAPTPTAPTTADAIGRGAQQARAEDDRAAANEPPAAAPPVRAVDAVAQDRAVADSPAVVLAERAALERAPAEEAPAVASAAGRGVADESEARARRLAATRWQPVTRTEAELTLGGTILVVEGLVVLEHARDRIDSGRVRTLQILGPDVSLELIQARTERREGFTGPARAGNAHVVTVVRNGFTILARAPISRDSLEVLLRRLRAQAP